MPDRADRDRVAALRLERVVAAARVLDRTAVDADRVVVERRGADDPVAADGCGDARGVRSRGPDPGVESGDAACGRIGEDGGRRQVCGSPGLGEGWWLR